MVLIQVEHWDTIKQELSLCWTEHWREVEIFQKEMPLDPDLEKLDILAKLNMLHIITVRDNKKLIGYHGSIVSSLMHHKNILAARSDLYWLHPNYRKGATGIKLLKEVEKTLRILGVQILYDTTKVYADNGKIFERLGYQPIERLYSKWIGD